MNYYKCVSSYSVKRTGNKIEVELTFNKTILQKIFRKEPTIENYSTRILKGRAPQISYWRADVTNLAVADYNLFKFLDCVYRNFLIFDK